MREGSVEVEEWKSVESGVEGKRVMGEITMKRSVFSR